MRVLLQLLLCLCLFTTIDISLGLSETNRFTCNQVFCQNAVLEEGSACPVKRNCSTQGNRRYLTPRECNCCEDVFCIQYSGEERRCSLESVPPEVNLCGPHLTCPQRVKECTTITATGCMSEMVKYNASFESGQLGTAQFKPACDGGGNYAYRQCLPGSLCFCANADGKRIFGAGLVTVPMDCKCARDIHQLQSISTFSGRTPRCLSNGNYDPMQCVGRKCWCMLKSDTKVDIAEIQKLPCFDKELHQSVAGSPYVRICDYSRAEWELQTHDNATAITLVPDFPQCDPDGYYSPVQSKNEKLVCVDIEGKQIGSYEVEKSSPYASKVDCYCARLQLLVEDIVNGKVSCCKHGNFRKWQCTGSICYCVDRDGKQVTTGPGPHEVYRDDVDQLKCYQSYGNDCVY